MMVGMGRDEDPMISDMIGLISTIRRRGTAQLATRQVSHTYYPLLVPLSCDLVGLLLGLESSSAYMHVLGFSAESANRGPSCAGGFLDRGTSPF